MKWTNAGGWTTGANKRSTVYHPFAWQWWCNMQATQNNLFGSTFGNNYTRMIFSVLPYLDYDCLHKTETMFNLSLHEVIPLFLSELWSYTVYKGILSFPRPCFYFLHTAWINGLTKVAPVQHVEKAPQKQQCCSLMGQTWTVQTLQMM